ncbi:unnamed protein product [Plutella xylostella]|uniref:(diamondback moth) hypothetical protein n=1 Tax=Plutella xylostella TaxID=51655 RepID=A0A8S4EM06_PLUXY|nr:unnamed protein product [Plutella xylostella]
MSEVKEGEEPLSPSLSEDCLTALLQESRKQEVVYKRHAITALGNALAATKGDKFHQLYDIVKVILSKNELLTDKDSDSDEDSAGARRRREQLTQLKEAAYELLGKAWPANPDTQEKYQEKFFEHCSSSYPGSSRSTQLSILTAMTRVLERLAVLSSDQMEVDSSGREQAVASVTAHVAAVVDFTLSKF